MTNKRTNNGKSNRRSFDKLRAGPSTRAAHSLRMTLFWGRKGREPQQWRKTGVSSVSFGQEEMLVATCLMVVRSQEWATSVLTRGCQIIR